jgi:triphosphoribosyl-dephospho-CoA synthase
VNATDFSLGRIAELACLLEVTAPKPGNVHRGADFEDVTFEDFVASAIVLGQVIDELADARTGETIRVAVERTQRLVGSNTNLGMILLIVPLAKSRQISREEAITPDHVEAVLKNLDSADATEVFEAIRLAKPGGIGKVEDMDVADTAETPINLMTAMELAKDRDLVAKQYVNGFEQVFEQGLPLLETGVEKFSTLSQAIVFAHVSLMSMFPDSLIARKCGAKLASQSQMMATQAIEFLDVGGDEAPEKYWNSVADLDFWLRSDGHRRNPGTTADIVAASLFVGINNNRIKIH